jgi:hypothetical protein
MGRNARIISFACAGAASTCVSKSEGGIVTKQVHVRDLGDPFPLVKLPSVHGGEIDFSSFRGKRLLIFSWSSW